MHDICNEYLNIIRFWHMFIFQTTHHQHSAELEIDGGLQRIEIAGKRTSDKK